MVAEKMEHAGKVRYSDFEKIFHHLNTLCWECNLDDQIIFDIAASNFAKISANCTQNRTVVRLAGQSGSGKTTQLLPCAKRYFAKKNLRPINLAVREFASLHPHYAEIIQKFGQSEMREKTNLFSLKCLLVTLIFAINDGYDILFEVTYLTPEFEDFVNQWLAAKHYQKINLVLAVNQKISDYFIEKRKNLAEKESGRIVYQTSADFFYNVLARAMQYYAQNYPQEKVIIWDAYATKPIYTGEFSHSLAPFAAARKNISDHFTDEDLLRNAKIDYLLNLD